MKKKILLSLIVIVALFTITGCGKSDNKESSNATKNDEVVNKSSCVAEEYLFHSKKRVKNIIYLDKNNKVINYERIETLYDFDSDSDFNMNYEICEDASKEIFNYYTQVGDCNRDTRILTITSKYNISKMKSKEAFPTKYIRDNISDDFILDLDNYLSIVNKNGYVCE